MKKMIGVLLVFLLAFQVLANNPDHEIPRIIDSFLRYKDTTSINNFDISTESSGGVLINEAMFNITDVNSCVNKSKVGYALVIYCHNEDGCIVDDNRSVTSYRIYTVNSKTAKEIALSFIRLQSNVYGVKVKRVVECDFNR